VSFATIFAGIVAVAEAVPAIKKIIEGFYDFYANHRISKIKQNEANDIKRRKALMRAISNAQTNEDRLALSITLHNFTVHDP